MKKTVTFLLLLGFLSTFSQEFSLVENVIKNVAINNEYSNFGTSFYDKNRVVFTSESSGGNLNLYIGDFTGGNIENFKPFSKSIKANTHESNIAVTNDKKTIYFTRSVYGKKNSKKISKNRNATIAIYKATLSDKGIWENIEPLPFNSERYDVAHPTLNKENTKLYFSSNMPGTIGDNDIFVVDIYPTGKYSKPKNLGPNINTKGKEMFPFISNKNFLYFTSNGYKENFGGLDIYYANLNDNNVSKAIHFEEPINSKWDDFAYIFNPKIRQGFFSSNRRGGKGKDDIYFVREKEKEIKKEEEEKEKKEKKCSQKIKGIIYKENGKNIIPSAVVILKDNGGKEIKSYVTKSSGRYYFNVACKKSYNILASRNDFFEKTKKIITSNINDSIVKNDFFLTVKENFIEKVEYGKVEKINFDFNNSGLLKRYSYKLDKAIRKMKENEKVFIEIESHTDSRGDDDANMNLTKERIKIITDYIINKGISIERIKSIAFGETKPLNKCVNEVKCSNEEYLINRRTTFVLKEEENN